MLRIHTIIGFTDGELPIRYKFEWFIDDESVMVQTYEGERSEESEESRENTGSHEEDDGSPEDGEGSLGEIEGSLDSSGSGLSEDMMVALEEIMVHENRMTNIMLGERYLERAHIQHVSVTNSRGINHMGTYICVFIEMC